MTNKLVAKRENDDYRIVVLYDAFPFDIGRLELNGIGYVFKSRIDTELAEQVNFEIGPRCEIKEALVIFRQVYDAKCERDRKESEAEHYAENGWLRAAELCDERRDEMEREDAMGLT